MNNKDYKITIYILYFLSFFASLIQNIYTPIISDLKHIFNVPISYINYTVGMFIWIVAFTQIILGKIIDERKNKIILVFSVLIIVITSIFCAITREFSVFALFRVLQAIGCGAIPLVCLTLLSKMSSVEERASVMSNYQIILSIAPAVAPILGGFIGQWYNYNGIFVFLSLLSIIFMSLLLYVPIPDFKNKGLSKTNRGYSTFLKNYNYMFMVMASFIVFFAYFGILVYIPVVLREVYHFPTSVIGLLFLPMTVSLILGSLFYKKKAKKYTSSNFIECLMICFSILLILFAWTNQVNVMVFSIVIFLVGFCVGMTPSLIATKITIMFEENKGETLALFNFIRYTGMGFGAMVIGYIASDNTPYYFSVIAILLVALCVVYYLKKFVAKV
ncbi:MFS transporter [Staphylococcus simulans]|uniref:MFS transporter n=1 Tax=Staphylococcus simulans TaxID=1286 RepID=UPI003999F9C9